MLSKYDKYSHLATVSIRATLGTLPCEEQGNNQNKKTTFRKRH